MSGRIILRIYGTQFLASAAVLGLLVWYLVVTFPTFIFTHILCLSHTKEFAIFYFIALVVNIGLNLFLIPIFGIIGVAFTAITSAFILGFLCYRKIYTDIFQLKIMKTIMMPFIASSGIVLFVFHFKTLSLLQLSAWSIVIYFLILYLIRGLTKDDLMLLASFIRSK